WPWPSLPVSLHQSFFGFGLSDVLARGGTFYCLLRDLRGNARAGVRRQRIKIKFYPAGNWQDSPEPFRYSNERVSRRSRNLVLAQPRSPIPRPKLLLDLSELPAGFKPMVEASRHVRAGNLQSLLAAVSDHRIKIEFPLPQI